MRQKVFSTWKKATEGREAPDLEEWSVRNGGSKKRKGQGQRNRRRTETAVPPRGSQAGEESGPHLVLQAIETPRKLGG